MSYFKAKMHQTRFQLGLCEGMEGAKGKSEWGENSPLYVPKRGEKSTRK